MKALRKNNLLEKTDQAVTYKSVMFKLSLLLVINITIGFLTYRQFSSIKGLKSFAHNFTLICDKLDFIENAFNNDSQKKDAYAFLVLFLPMGIFFLSAILWAIGFFSFRPLLKISTIFLSLAIGFFFGSFLSLLAFRGKAFQHVNQMQTGINIVVLFFTVPLVGTILFLVFMSLLYFLHKKAIPSRFLKTVQTLFILSLIVLFISLLCVFSNKWYINIIAFLLALFSLFIGAWMWVIALDVVDKFVKEQIPQKYEWIVISLLLIAILQIFTSIFKMVSILYRLSTEKDN